MPRRSIISPTCFKIAAIRSAVAHYRKAADILKATQGETHPNYAMALSNLADLYRSQGNHEQAETLAVQAMKILKDSVGEEHPLYAMVLCNLGQIHLARKDLAGAEPLLQQGATILKERVGDPHPYYATSHRYLAELYVARCDYEKAELLIKEALAIDELVFGSNHPRLIEPLSTYTALLYRTDRDDEAKAVEARIKKQQSLVASRSKSQGVETSLVE